MNLGGNVAEPILSEDEAPRDRKLEVAVAHSIPGRLRVTIPLLVSRKDESSLCCRYLASCAGVTSAVSNYRCGSITICYDDAVTGEQALLDLLSGPTLGELLDAGEKADVPAEPIAPVSNGVDTKGLKMATAGVSAGLTLPALSTLAVVPVGILLVWLSMPTYKRAAESLLVRRRFTLDHVYSISLSIGILGGHVGITSIAVWFIYFGDYVDQLVRSGPGARLLGVPLTPGEGNPETKKGRLIRLCTGAAVTVVGTVMVPLPGPGIVIMTVGLGILASEFPWADKLYRKMKGPAPEAG